MGCLYIGGLIMGFRLTIWNVNTFYKVVSEEIIQGFRLTIWNVNMVWVVGNWVLLVVLD